MVLSCEGALVTIAAAKFEEAVEFYRQLLGRSPEISIPNVYVEFQLLGLRLGIFKPKQIHQSEFAGQSSGGMSLCLEVEDLEAAIEHLRSIGASLPGEIMIASHGREIYAYDPAGNRLILHSRG
jgi:predicted enzyme related to lactoylglutathione lyase